MNGAAGGAAMSTLALIDAFRGEGIGACAVCHDAGTFAEQELIREATAGEVVFTPLYWWNRKTRAKWWKRPALELRQIWRTGGGRRSATRVAQFARDHNVDLIHTNTFMTPEGGIAARSLGLPHVWHVRELVGPGTPYPLKLDGRALRKFVSAHASKVIANSNASAAPIGNWMPRDLLEVVPNGIDLSQFHVHRGPAASGRLIVAMVGSLTSQSKKHELFVEAAARVNRNLHIEWRIYGHDPSRGGSTRGNAYTERLHASIAHHNLAGRFTWPGFVAEPAQIMSQIDLLVHPADNESFGRVVVEAMAAALPVVGVRGGGVGEIVDHGQTGLLADPNSASDLAAAIEKLAGDPQLRARFGEAGRRRAEEHYSLEACAQGVLRVYRLAMQQSLPGKSDPGAASLEPSRSL